MEERVSAACLEDVLLLLSESSAVCKATVGAHSLVFPELLPFRGKRASHAPPNIVFLGERHLFFIVVRVVVALLRDAERA